MAMTKCRECGNPVEFGGRLCDDCVIDRAEDEQNSDEVSEGDFLDFLQETLDPSCHDDEFNDDVTRIRTFENVGYMTNDVGLVVTWKGKKFNLTIQEDRR